MGRPAKVQQEQMEIQPAIVEKPVGVEVQTKVEPEVGIPSDALKVKLTLPNAKLPSRNNPTDAGLDLYATEEIIVPAKDCKFMDFGVQMEIPEGYTGFIFARSGLGSKEGIRPRNCVGVIDQHYRDNLKIMVENNGDNPYHIKTGDRIAQIVFLNTTLFNPIKVDEIDRNSDRGGGFGTSGK